MAEGQEKKESGAQPGVFNDPYRSYNFHLIIRGVAGGHFTYCSNISMKVEAIQYREGGTQQLVHQLPGRVEHGEVTLRFGLTESREMFDWMMGVANGKCERKSVAIVIFDADGVGEKLRWNLANAWPTSWRAAPLDALGREVAIEEMTLVYEAIDRA